jgi:hypothetical protein
VHQVGGTIFNLQRKKLLNIEKKNSLKSHLNQNLKFIWEFGQALGMIGKPLMGRI